MEQVYVCRMESALAKVEGELDGAMKAAITAAGNIKKARAAAQAGTLRDIKKALDASEQAADALLKLVADIRAGWEFNGEEHMASGGYVQELLGFAKELNLDIFEMDGLLYCYPFLVRMLPGELAVQIDKTKERRVRPAVLVRQLKTLQDKPVRFKPEAFLESLYAAYSVRGKKNGESSTLMDLYKTFTLLPGASREYTLAEFARDVYLLDQSSVTVTKDGKELRLAASTGTRGLHNTLRVITRDGQERKYHSISFH